MGATAKPVGGDSPHARPPDTVGRYRLCFQIARGGMATVYLARAEGPGGFSKLFAVKCIHPHLSDQQEFVQMFLDEARLASRIEHRNVCQVFDFGAADGIYYLAMEHVRGETLATIHRRACKPPEMDKLYPWVVARCVADAARGVHAAHEVRDDMGRSLELVHRDISPGNVMVGYDGGVRVLDFGIARALGRATETVSGVMKGKLAYMAPEQLRKQPASRQTDVFALGVVLWECLTRQRLFRGPNDADTLMAVLSRQVEPPSSVRPDVGKALDAVVLRALERDPTARTQTAIELARGIDEALEAAGVYIDAGQVGEWISHEFAENRAQADTLTQLARQVEHVPRVHRQGDHDSMSGTQVSPAPDVGAATAAAAASGRGRFKRAHVATLGAVVVAVLLGLGVAWSAGGLSAPEGSSTNSPPTRSAEPTEDPIVSEATPPAVSAAPSSNSNAPSKVAAATPAAVEPPPARAAKHRPRPAASGASGAVLVITPGGWADIYDRGRRLGRSPGTITLAPGSHVLELRRPGQPPLRRTVRVVADQQQTLTVRLAGT